MDAMENSGSDRSWFLVSDTSAYDWTDGSLHQTYENDFLAADTLSGDNDSWSVALLNLECMLPEGSPSPLNDLEGGPAPSDTQTSHFPGSSIYESYVSNDSVAAVNEHFLSLAPTTLSEALEERSTQPAQSKDRCQCQKYRHVGKPKQYSKSEWDEIKPYFLKYYLVHGMELKAVRLKLAQDFNFHATEQMYKKRITNWGAYRNMDKAQKHLVKTYIAARDQYGPNDSRTKTSHRELLQFCLRNDLDAQVILDFQQQQQQQQQQRTASEPGTTKSANFTQQENNDSYDSGMLQSTNTIVSQTSQEPPRLSFSSMSLDPDCVILDDGDDDVQEISEAAFNRCFINPNQKRPSTRLERTYISHGTTQALSVRTEDNEMQILEFITDDDDTEHDSSFRDTRFETYTSLFPHLQ